MTDGGEASSVYTNISQHLRGDVTCSRGLCTEMIQFSKTFTFSPVYSRRPVWYFTAQWAEKENRWCWRDSAKVDDQRTETNPPLTLQNHRGREALNRSFVWPLFLERTVFGSEDRLELTLITNASPTEEDDEDDDKDDDEDAGDYERNHTRAVKPSTAQEGHKSNYWPSLGCP